MAQIVAVQELNKYRSCFSCKARVEPVQKGLGRCSKEDCQMLQKYDVCPEQLYKQNWCSWVNQSSYPCTFYGTTLLDLAGKKDTHLSKEILLLYCLYSSLSSCYSYIIISYLWKKKNFFLFELWTWTVAENVHTITIPTFVSPSHAWAVKMVSSRILTVAWTELSKGKRSKKHYLGTSCISSVDERKKYNNFIDACTILLLVSLLWHSWRLTTLTDC